MFLRRPHCTVRRLEVTQPSLDCSWSSERIPTFKVECFSRFVNYLDSDGLTPLHKASMEGHWDIIQMIAEMFPTVMRAKDIHGREPADVAATPEMEQYLRGGG